MKRHHRGVAAGIAPASVFAALVAAAAAPAAPAFAQSGIRTVELGRKLNSGGPALKGFVDLHTHPMNHLSFGGKIFHGAPDVGVLMPKDMRGCGKPAGRAASMAEALASCAATHNFVTTPGSPAPGPLGCGDVIRGSVIRVLEDEKGAQMAHGDLFGTSLPDPKAIWPAYNDIMHQQMWIDWIRRAYDGGLRVMVALVTNSVTFGAAANGEKPYDDASTINVEIAEMKTMAARPANRSWMEIATSASHLRKIVEQDKLAVVLGVEVDDFGNLRRRQRDGAPLPEADIRAEVDRLHRLGVRYVFPVHVVDNALGGTAAYEDPFSLANRYQSGYWWSLKCAPGIRFAHSLDGALEFAAAIKLQMDPEEHPALPACPKGQGHVNMRGLTYRGRVALDQMMRREMIIDVDHMSHRTIDDVIAVADGYASGGYPLVSGHSGLLEVLPGAAEDHKRAAHYEAIKRLGGIAGVGYGGLEARKWVESVGKVRRFMGTGLALGSDINGFVVQPSPPDCKSRKSACGVRYDTRFPQPKTGARSWDYNKHGVAHYGLVPDFLRDVQQIPAFSVASQPVGGTPASQTVSGGDVIDALYAGAEAFARTWAKAEQQGRAGASAASLPADQRLLTNIGIGPFCPSAVLRGDREFGGHGPDYEAKVTLRIADGAAAASIPRAPGVGTGTSALVAKVFFHAEEVGGDRSTTEGTWERVVAIAPPGFRFERLLSGASSAVQGRSSKAGFQFVVATDNGARAGVTPSTGDLVDEFTIVGDTGGPDISTDDDCRDDTAVSVTFNPIKVKLAALSTAASFDSLDVFIQTGGDDVRGGPGSAMVSVEFAGGTTKEIDVTHLGKGGGTKGSVRVTLPRKMTLADLRSLKLRHVSNKCDFCTGDFWDVTNLVVSAGGVGTLASVPAFRFGDSTKVVPLR
jgi:microsomal dipeptidase-like Zn-dependent dipeptidase